MVSQRAISTGFWLAGLANIGGVLIFSLFFTNTYLNEISPEVMSRFGLVCIILWGLAFISVAKTYERVSRLILLFAIEKFVYFGSWVWLITREEFSLSLIFQKSILAGLFYGIYGLNDLIFSIFFFCVYARLVKLKPELNSQNRMPK